MNYVAYGFNVLDAVVSTIVTFTTLNLAIRSEVLRVNSPT
jgi:hypothetical protein